MAHGTTGKRVVLWMSEFFTGCKKRLPRRSLNKPQNDPYNSSNKPSYVGQLSCFDSEPFILAHMLLLVM